MEEKICCRCQESKSILDFSKDSRNKDGLKGECKKCHNQYMKDWKIKNPEQAKESKKRNYPSQIKSTLNYRKRNPLKCKKWSKDYRERLTLEVLTHYSNGTPKCICCGEIILKFLTIDHIEGNGHKHRKEIGITIYLWLKQQGYPEGYQIMCMNCNHGRMRNGGICPHKDVT